MQKGCDEKCSFKKGSIDSARSIKGAPAVVSCQCRHFEKMNLPLLFLNLGQALYFLMFLVPLFGPLVLSQPSNFMTNPGRGCNVELSSSKPKITYACF